MPFRLGGLVAAPYTPFDEQGELRLGVIERQVEHLVASGVDGVFVCGTTGEGVSMTLEERMAVAKRWVEAAKASLKVVVHVGHNCQRDAMALAEHAAQIKASAIAALPPFFYKPGNAEEVVGFTAPIAKAGGALPFYFYHIPIMTGLTVSMHDFLTAADGRIGNLHGIKFTHSDLMDYQRCLALGGGKYEIAWGRDEMLLGALACGATAGVGSTYNYAGAMYVKMVKAFRANDLETARGLGRKSTEIVAILQKYGGIRTGKFAMALAGVDCGPPRSPNVALSEGEKRAIAEAFARVEAFAIR